MEPWLHAPPAGSVDYTGGPWPVKKSDTLCEDSTATEAPGVADDGRVAYRREPAHRVGPCKRCCAPIGLVKESTWHERWRDPVREQEGRLCKREDREAEPPGDRRWKQ
jgi:hypothetical protein